MTHLVLVNSPLRGEGLKLYHELDIVQIRSFSMLMENDVLNSPQTQSKDKKK